jgi:hypothetical protein
MLNKYSLTWHARPFTYHHAMQSLVRTDMLWSTVPDDREQGKMLLIWRAYFASVSRRPHALASSRSTTQLEWDNLREISHEIYIFKAHKMTTYHQPQILFQRSRGRISPPAIFHIFGNPLNGAA